MYGRALLVAIILGIVANIYHGTLQESRPNFQPVAGRNNTVLFVTTEHPGFCNVHLATAYSLLTNHPHINIHYASFPKVAKRLEKISEVAVNRGADGASIIFHPLQSEGYVDSLLRVRGDVNSMRHEPGMRGIDSLVDMTPAALAPWSAEDYWGLYQRVTKLIDEVDPSMVVIDTFFHPGIDATRNNRRLHALITPNLLTDMLPAQQPLWTMLWKYPAVGSGLAYPVPWRLIPTNMYMNFKLIRGIMKLPEMHAKQAWLRAKGVKNPIDFIGLYRPYMPWLTQTLPGAHLPMVRIPTNVTLTGPINLIGLEEETEKGKELLGWVQRKKTVLIALGSGFTYDERAARSMMQALENVLSVIDNVQVLWKFDALYDFDKSFINHGLANFADRLRIEKWLDVELPTLLMSGHITVFVHHGGAGCYHDAISTGVPQIMLPQWADLYDIAQVAETIGVGIWACRDNSPFWTVECLEHALLSVLHENPTGASLLKNAASFGQLSNSMGPGRDAAAKIVAELAGSGHS